MINRFLFAFFVLLSLTNVAQATKPYCTHKGDCTGQVSAAMKAARANQKPGYSSVDNYIFNNAMIANKLKNYFSLSSVSGLKVRTSYGFTHIIAPLLVDVNYLAIVFTVNNEHDVKCVVEVEDDFGKKHPLARIVDCGSQTAVFDIHHYNDLRIDTGVEYKVRKTYIEGQVKAKE